MTDLNTIIEGNGEISFEETTTDELMKLSIEPFNEIWEASENDHWDEFLKN